LEEANQSGLINEVGVFAAVSGGPFLDGERYAHAGLQPVKTIHPKLNSIPGCEKALIPLYGRWSNWLQPRTKSTALALGVSRPLVAGIGSWPE